MIFPSPAGMSLTELSLAGKKLTFFNSISFLSHISHLLLLLSSIFFVPPKSFVTFVFFYVFLVSLDVTCIGVGTFPYFFKSRNLCVFVSHFSAVSYLFLFPKRNRFSCFLVVCISFEIERYSVFSIN